MQYTGPNVFALPVLVALVFHWCVCWLPRSLDAADYLDHDLALYAMWDDLGLTP